jgi:hypothetical protein
MSLLLLWLSNFIKWKQFDFTCQLISLFSTLRTKILPFVEMFNRHFRVLILEYFSVRLVGTCQRTKCTVQYIITTAVRSVLPPPEHTPHSDIDCMYIHEHSARSPRQTITIIQSDINVKMSSFGNGGEYKKPFFTFSASENLLNNFLKCCTRALNHPVRPIKLQFIPHRQSTESRHKTKGKGHKNL